MLQRANEHLTGRKTQRNFLCAQQHERQYSIVKLFHLVQCVSEQASQKLLTRFLQKLTPTSTILQQKCSNKYCSIAHEHPIHHLEVNR